MEYQKWLAEKFISLGTSFGYQEYEGSILEHMDLYLGKSSEEIVNRQTFSLTDRDGRLLVLRPELTPTLARMVAQREGQTVFPVRWQSYGQFFRYERPQRGRARAFFQWNIDLLGSESHAADAEIITIACLLFKNLGLTPDHVTIKINDRRGAGTAFTHHPGHPPPVDSPGCSPLWTEWIKCTRRNFTMELEKIGLSENKIDRLDHILKTRDLTPFPWLQQILTQLDLNGVAQYVEPDLKIVRGFDYYTRTVFEAWAKTTLRRAVFGGGRYDNLTVQVGGKRDLPGVGFALGDMAMTELLKEVDLYPEIRTKCADVLGYGFFRGPYRTLGLFCPHRQRTRDFHRTLSEPRAPAGQATEVMPTGREFPPLSSSVRMKSISNAVVVKDLVNRTQRAVARDCFDALWPQLKTNTQATEKIMSSTQKKRPMVESFGRLEAHPYLRRPASGRRGQCSHADGLGHQASGPRRGYLR